MQAALPAVAVAVPVPSASPSPSAAAAPAAVGIGINTDAKVPSEVRVGERTGVRLDTSAGQPFNVAVQPGPAGHAVNIDVVAPPAAGGDGNGNGNGDDPRISVMHRGSAAVVIRAPGSRNAAPAPSPSREPAMYPVVEVPHPVTLVVPAPVVMVDGAPAPVVDVVNGAGVPVAVAGAAVAVAHADAADDSPPPPPPPPHPRAGDTLDAVNAALDDTLARLETHLLRGSSGGAAVSHHSRHHVRRTRGSGRGA